MITSPVQPLSPGAIVSKMGKSPGFAKDRLAPLFRPRQIPLRHFDEVILRQDTPWTQWSADCSACAALCCIDLAFDAGGDFAHDKAAGEPCQHLAGHACRLHGNLAQSGYPGCARYDCLGAGQRAVTMGRPDLFASLRRLHDSHLMLKAALALNLPPAAKAEAEALIQALQAEAPQSAESLAAFEAGPLPSRVRTYLKGLRPLLTHR